MLGRLLIKVCCTNNFISCFTFINVPTVQNFKDHAFQRIGPPQSITRIYRVRIIIVHPRPNMDTHIPPLVLPGRICVAATVGILFGHCRGALDHLAPERTACPHLDAHPYLQGTVHLHNRGTSRIGILPLAAITDRPHQQTLLPWIITVRSFPSGFTAPIPTIVLFTGLVCRAAGEENPYVWLPGCRLYLYRLLVHHVLLAGLPLDVRQLGILRLHYRRVLRRPGPRDCLCRTLLAQLRQGSRSVP